MLNSLRRSFGMSPSSSSIHADYTATNDAPASVLSPSNKPNTFVPIRRSNSFTNFFSSSPPSSPIKEIFDQSPSKTMTSSAKASSSAACEETSPDPVLAFLILLDKKGRQIERFPIQSLMTTMGRSLENDVRFLGSDISRHHCTIEIEIEQEQSTEGTKAFLQLLGVNGVLLNSTQVYPAPRGKGRYELATGDSIVIAKRPFLFELPQQTAQTAAPSIFTSPVKGSAQSAVPQTPATAINRRVRMSLVNAAQIDTPSKPSAARQLASLSKTNNAEREARRANGLQRFIQSAGVSPSKANKSRRQSLSLSTSTSNIFATPVKSRSTTVEPKTAPPKQVSFSLRSSGYSGRMSPVKQMRMMPPLDTMNEEQDGSFCSEDEQLQEQQEVQEEADDQEESTEVIVIVEEIEQEQAQPAAPMEEPQPAAHMEEAEEVAPITYDNASKNKENLENIFSTQSSSSTPAGSPSKSVSPKRAKRRSSFFGRAGPFAGMSLGFYAEERSEPAPVEPEQQPPQPELPAEEFSDASSAEHTPMEDEQPLLSPITHRVSSRPMKLGISKTPSPVKKQHFIGLTPLPRRPRLSLATKRNVSLRTKTLLRSSEAYADRLFLPPPPPTPSSPESGGLSKSVSMPSNLSAMTPPPAFDTSSCSAVEDVQELQQSEEVCKEVCEEDDFQSRLDPALSEEAQPQAWKGDSDDEVEVDQSLSCLSPSPQKTAPSYLFSPVKASSLPHFATPQPMSKSHARRISMPPIGVADAKPSNRSALVRLQISGAGERIIHENPRKPEAPQVEQASPSKARKVVRVSEVGLPATELSMGFDVLQGASAEQEPEEIAEALNDLFNAEEEELTDVEEEPEKQEEIVQINSSPARRSAPQMPLQTPAALNSIRHMFSAAANTAPATPDMNGLATMLQTSPEKTAQYGTLGDRMRANPDISQLLSPANVSRRKEAEVEASPIRGRRGVRRSEVAEMPVALPATPKASVAREASSLPSPFVQAERDPEPAFQAELYVTMFDAAEMDAQNEAIIQAFAEAEEQQGSEQGGVLEQEADLEPEAGFEQKAEPEPIYQPDPNEELVQDAPLEEVATEEPVALSDTAEQAHVEEEQVVEPVHKAAIVKESVIEEPAIVKPVAAEPCLVKPRAASESPTKRTAARSDSPTKHNTRSSPVKRASAAEPNGVFEEESSAPVVEEVPVESSSPTKPTRRTGGRKAKLAATEAISAGFTVEVPPPTFSRKKPAGRTKAAAASKKAEAQAAEPEHDEREVAEEEAPPKARSTRTRTTRPAAAPAKAVRSTRSRGAKDAQPSSSAGFGDDEASEAEEEAKGKKIVKARTAAAPKSKSTRSTRAAAAVEDSGSDLAEVKEQEEAPKPKTRATRAKAAPATTSRSKARKADAEEAATSSSATTTRSGRTTRRTAAAK